MQRGLNTWCIERCALMIMSPYPRPQIQGGGMLHRSRFPEDSPRAGSPSADFQSGVGSLPHVRAEAANLRTVDDMEAEFAQKRSQKEDKMPGLVRM